MGKIVEILRGKVWDTDKGDVIMPSPQATEIEKEILFNFIDKNKVRRIIIFILCNEMYPLPQYPTADEVNNREKEAMKKYQNCPILNYKVEKAMNRLLTDKKL